MCVELQTKESMMKRAIELAEKGRGHVSPNPLTGAVIAQHDEIIGEGFFSYIGAQHAEEYALDAAKTRAKGGQIFLPLEPCIQHGSGFSCVDKIMEAGIEEVYIAVSHPNPRISGKAIEKLQKAGLKVEIGLCEKAALLQQ